MVILKIRNILIVVCLAGGLALAVRAGEEDRNGLVARQPADSAAIEPSASTDSPKRHPFGSLLRLVQPQKESADEPAETSPLRDPTEPEPGMRDVVVPLRMGSQGAAAGTEVPQMVLKGRVVGPRASAAMVEIDGTLQTLRQGSEWTRPGRMPGLSGITLRVEEITASEVRIQVLPLDQVIVLR